MSNDSCVLAPQESCRQVTDVLKQIFNNDEQLKGAQYLFHEDFPIDIIGINLEFLNRSVCILVDEDEDTLYLSTDKPELSGLQVKKAHYPFRNAFGMRIRWFWKMINNQGYVDGLQIELADTVNDTPVVIQLMAIASKISIKVLTEVSI